MKQSTLHRFFSQNRFDLHLELHRIDCLASHKILDVYEFCKSKFEYFQAQPPPPLKLIGGNDLMQLGFSPGKQMGEILRAVEDEILEGKVKTKEEALTFVKSSYGPSKK